MEKSCIWSAFIAHQNNWNQSGCTEFTTWVTTLSLDFMHHTLIFYSLRIYLSIFCFIPLVLAPSSISLLDFVFFFKTFFTSFKLISDLFSIETPPEFFLRRESAFQCDFKNFPSTTELESTLYITFQIFTF